MDYLEYGNKTAAELEEILRLGTAPDPQRLAGFEWRGYNTLELTRLVGIKKFIKGFFRNASGAVEGYNIPVRQNGLKDAWLHKPDADSPKRFGFFLVLPAAARPGGDPHPQSVLLDYGASSRNAVYRVERLLRDYVVVPDPANPDILLGKAALALGAGRPALSFFVIERLRPASWKPTGE